MRIITGEFKGRRLESVADSYLRPIDDRVKEAVFNILAPRLEGAKGLDLFAGTGAIGLEALSRGAASICFVEKERAFQAVLKKNIQKLQVEARSNVWPGDAFAVVPRFAEKGERFDLIFVDPPYFDRVEVHAKGKLQQTRGVRKPKEEREILQFSATEPLPQLILKYLDQYPILNPSGVGMIRTFKKVPLEFEGLRHLGCFRQERYGDAVVSFFKVK